MGWGQVALGIACILIGIGVFIKTSAWIPSLIPALLGIGLIIFRKAEDKIEERRDK